MIPDKNLYIVTSALRPVTGVWTPEQRFEQTIKTLQSIREKDSKAIILLTDSSVKEVPEADKQTISGFCNFYYDLTQNEDVKKLSSIGHSSMAETALLFHTLSHVKMQPFIKDCKRIFKFSGRSMLEADFDSEEHNIFGKYVFKKRIPTWMGQPQSGASHLLITRMFSFCPSLLDNYLEVLVKNFNLLNSLDTEHAHFVNIPKQHLVEFDKLHCFGWLSGGSIEHY
jgi:hypothetical protein